MNVQVENYLIEKLTEQYDKRYTRKGTNINIIAEREKKRNGRNIDNENC